VTVKRPSIFLRNLRYIVPIVFCPARLPRPIPDSLKRMTVFPNSGPYGPVEALFPEPPIIITRTPIPITIIMKQTVESSAALYIRSVRMVLKISTRYHLQHDWIVGRNYLELLNQRDLQITLSPGQRKLKINPAQLLPQSDTSTGLSLPNNIAPSFRTCNVVREYALGLMIEVSNSLTNPQNYWTHTYKIDKPVAVVVEDSTASADALHHLQLEANSLGTEPHKKMEAVLEYDQVDPEVWESWKCV
jgi:hypothetical protein